MVRKIDPESTVGSRYKALVVARELALKDLYDFLSQRFPSEITKVKTFLREGTNATESVRKALISFASDKLMLVLTDAWFSADWHPSAPIEFFMEKNHIYSSIVRSICGEYAVVSKFMSGGDANGDPAWRATPLHIRDMGLYFCFEMGRENQTSTNKDHFSGFVIYHSDTMYLNGFDTSRREKAIFLVLRPAPPELGDQKVKFWGLVAGTLAASNMPNGRAIAKRVVLVPDVAWRSWEDGKNMPESVSDWLLGQDASISVNLYPVRAEGSW